MAFMLIPGYVQHTHLNTGVLFCSPLCLIEWVCKSTNSCCLPENGCWEFFGRRMIEKIWQKFWNFFKRNGPDKLLRNLEKLQNLSMLQTFCFSVCLFVYLSVYLSICYILSLSLCLFVCLSVCLFVCLSVCLSVCSSICLFVYCL